MSVDIDISVVDAIRGREDYKRRNLKIYLQKYV
jgi:hypothetical protein